MSNYQSDRPRPNRNRQQGIHEDSDFSFGGEYIQDASEFRPGQVSRRSGNRPWVNVGESAYSGDVGGHPYTNSEYDENPSYTGGGSETDSRPSFAGLGPKGYKRSDERITEDIHEHLTWDHDVDASGIRVETKNGEVVLTGTVTDRRSKRRAEDIALSCSGVKDVLNQLRIHQDATH